GCAATSSRGGCSLVVSRAATRSAVPTAQRPDVTAPSTTIVTPQTAMIHHAAARPPVATTAPITAMPSEEPTCRLVAATAAATPAGARGTRDTAVFVMGALTKPKPSPNNAYVRASRTYEGWAELVTSTASTPLAVMAAPASTSGIRGPRLP